MQLENRELLISGLQAFGLEAPEGAVAMLERHLAAVQEWNERFNLTRIIDERDAVLKHIIDSATCWHVIKPWHGMRVLDVGSGAGYPGVVLKALFPGAEVTVLEATQKKCRFLEHVRDEVVGSGFAVVCARAETAAHQPAYREAFDLVVARAVAELRVLAELTLGFVRVGGRLLAMKGPGGAAEAEAGRSAVQRLGGGTPEVQAAVLPGGAGERLLIVVDKVAATPAQYPRQPGMPERRPL